MKNLPVKIWSNALPPEKKTDFEQVKKSQTSITDVKFSKVYIFENSSRSFDLFLSLSLPEYIVYF